MTVYIRRVGEVADGSVTETKLADSAVNLAGNKITGQLDSANIADSAVTEAKLDSLAVSTAKLQDQAVTLAKAHQAVNLHHFTGDETEVSVTGTTETEKKTFKIVKASDQTKGFQPTKLHINAEMKTSDVAKQGSVKVYIDSEETPAITLNTSSTTYEMIEGNSDISSLSTGAHEIHVKLVNAEADGTTYNDLIEIFLEK
jgi:hypothetical protein